MTNELIKRVTMPKWGLSMKTGKITDWVAAEGDEIAEGDDLADIDTDKIAGTLEAADAGVLRRIVAERGADIPVGATIAVLAPAEVPDAEIDEVVEQARAELASGAVEEVAGPISGTAQVGGRSIAFAVLGDESASSEPIVLVHGFGGDKNSWLFVQEPLSADRAAYAVDLPGHGESSKDVGDGSLDTLADTLLGFLAAQGIGRAHLVGHSFGAAVATAVSAKDRGKVASLTLVAPAGFGPEINAGYLRGFTTATSRRELKPHLAALFADPGQVTRQLTDDLLRYKRLDGVDQALTTLLDTLLDGDQPALDVLAVLPADVPLAVVWGAQDAVLPVTNAASLAGRTDVIVVQGAGHMVHMEKPGAVVDGVRQAVKGA